MCGIVGFLANGAIDQSAKAELTLMAQAIKHRGPDASGCWIDGTTGIGLAHRRLAVVDLSAAGSQPMVSGSERYVVSYNGEIYNHRAIRQRLQLESPHLVWRGTSDTETFLQAVDSWGLMPAIASLVGMFAIAIWDKQQRTLHLVRDRMGEKPLYYGWLNGRFTFASELKPLRGLVDAHADLDRAALSLYFRLGYIPAPHSIFRSIKSLVLAILFRSRRGISQHSRNLIGL